MIEQPLQNDDLVDHAKLQKVDETPLCLDESIVSQRHAQAALDLESCRIINIKVGRVGGYSQALGIHDLCAVARYSCLVRRHARIRHRSRAQHRPRKSERFHFAR